MPEEPQRHGENPLHLSTEMMHTAARVEDTLHSWFARRGLDRGYRPTVIPYDSYGGVHSVRILARTVLTKDGRPETHMSKSIRGWRSFRAVPLNKEVAWVRVGGQEHVVQADRGGVIDAEIPGEFTPGWTTAELWCEGSEVVTVSIRIIGPEQTFGIISDIDDTVMVTKLPRPLLAAWNTFVLDEHARSAVAGMAVLYDRLVYLKPDTPMFYLSTGAWNVAPTLKRFLSRHLYPAGPLLLTDWGPTTDRVFRSGTEHKRSTLARLAREFPWVKWLLIGDDGQHDEEIYGEFVENHPENVVAVAIRELSVGEAVWAGGRSKGAGRGRGVPWIYAPDGAGLASKLMERGIL